MGHGLRIASMAQYVAQELELKLDLKTSFSDIEKDFSYSEAKGCFSIEFLRT